MPVVDEEFAALIGAGDLNETIVLASVDADSSPASGILITARISNRARSWAVFPPEYGAIGYVLDSEAGKWEAVPNQVRLPDLPYLLGPLGGTAANSSIVVYSPGKKWPGAGPIRLVVQGRLRNADETPGEVIAAFVDVPPPE